MGAIVLRRIFALTGLTVGLLMGAAVCGVAGAAEGDAQLQPLIAQAHYWEDRGRYDLARESWLKLLRVQPDDAQALEGLAMAEARSNKPEAAEVYLERLKEAHPKHPAISRIEAAIQQGAIDQTKLEEPRGLARQGRYQEAVESYRTLFGGEVPGGRLGLEYYQTLAGVDGKWGEARQGIERLAKDYPDDPVYRLALAQHLTYREDSRRDGISRLAQLADNAAVSVQARQAWRQALLWLSTDPNDRRYYQAYLDEYGNDPEVAAKLRSVQEAVASVTPQADPRVAEVQEAYESLNGGELAAASARFEDLLRDDPRDADGLGGLGIVRLRQQRFAEAASLLEQASIADPKRSQRWSEALSSARFYALVREAETARQAAQPERAEQLLRSALAADGVDDDSDVRSTLADVLAEQDEIGEAEQLYRQILSRHPDNMNATRGLVGLLTRSNRIQEAIQLAERLPPELRNQIGSLSQLKAQYLRDQATEATEAGDQQGAENLLKQALLLDPNSVWVRLDLARIYQQQKRTREANTLVDGILSGNPNMGEAIFVKALLLSEQQRWYDALQLMEQIPLSTRDTGMVQLQHRLWVRYQTERAGVYARYGRIQDALELLRRVEPQVDNAPELLGALATAYAEVGDEGRALGYIRAALSGTPDPDPGLRLQYASLLFKLRQDAEFEVVMTDLVQRGGLTQQQALDLANLRVAYRLRQADLVREEGDLARAYDYLAPLLQVNPNDPRLLMALARLYNDSEEYDHAAQIYDRVLQTDPENLDAYKGSIGAALARNDLETANQLLNEAFNLDPQNARLYALAGRLARARGEDGRALEYYQRALALDAQQGAQEFGGRYAPQLYLLDPAAAGSRALPAPSDRGGFSFRPSSAQSPRRSDSARAREAAWQPARGGGYLIKTAAPRRSAEPQKSQTPEERFEPVPRVSVDQGIRPSIYSIEPAPMRAEPEPVTAQTRPASQTGTDAPRTHETPGVFLKLSTQSNGERVTRSAETPWTLPPPPSTRSSNAAVPLQMESLQAPPFPPPRLSQRPDYRSGSESSLSAPATMPALPTYSAPSTRRELTTAPDPNYQFMPEVSRSTATSGPAPAPMAPGSQAPLYPPSSRSAVTSSTYRQTTSTQVQPYSRSYAEPAPVVPSNAVPASAYPSTSTVQQSNGTVSIPYGPLGSNASVVPAGPSYYSSQSGGTQTQTRSEVYTQGQAQTVRRFDPPSGQAPYPAGGLPPASAPRMSTQLSSSSGDPALRRELSREINDIRGAYVSQPAPQAPVMSYGNDPALTVPSFARRELPPTRERSDLIREIESIEANRAANAGLGVALRNRDGQSGLGRLLDIELPVEASIAGTEAGRFAIRAVPVFLDAGSVSGRDQLLFGAMPLVDDATSYRFAQDASGVAVGGVYSIADLRLDVGSSPLGFPVETIVGGLQWKPQVDNVSFKIDLSRRSVTDSLLSYAGTRDPATGRVWGGITRTGGRIDMSYDLGRYGVYVNGSYHVLDGENVDQNNAFEAGGGFYTRGVQRRGFRVTYGLNLTTFFYDKNRRYYTFGHGGYFSPQFYMSVGVPFEISGSRDRFSYRIGGAIGLQAFKEDGAALFPTDAGLQLAVEDLLLDSDDEDLVSGYSDSSQSGVGYNFSGAFEYLIAPQLTAGALLSLDNAKDYNESLVMGYVRYWFSAQPRVSSPPTMLRPYFNFGSD